MAEDDVMKLDELQRDWFTFTATADHHSMITGELEFASGDRGYIRRNDHDPKYFQIVTKRGEFIHGCYVSEKEAAKCVEVNVPITEGKNKLVVNRYWSGYWTRKFHK